MTTRQIFWIYNFLQISGYIEGRTTNEIIKIIHENYDVAVTKEQVEDIKANYKKYKKMYASRNT